MQNSKTKFLTRVGVLSTIAFALMYLEFSVPLFPAFLKFDLSDVPALLGGFALGPLAGTVIELIKNLLFLFIKGTTTGGVGELANFVIGTAWVVPAAIIYRKNKTKKNAIKALVAGAVSMVVAAALLNYFVMLPLYAKIMPIEAIIAMGSAVNPNIVSFETLVLFGITPFNIFKTSIVSVVTALMYKKVSPVLHK